MIEDGNSMLMIDTGGKPNKKKIKYQCKDLATEWDVVLLIKYRYICWM